MDVLQYWKANEGKYLKLSKLARDLLSIPITIFASESAFSLGGHILDKYQNALLSNNVEALFERFEKVYISDGRIAESVKLKEEVIE